MSNYLKTILINIHWILYYVIKARIWMRHPERHSPRLRSFAAYWVGVRGKLGMPPDPVTDPLFPEEGET